MSNPQDYDKDYFVGGTKSNYDDYANCGYILTKWATVVFETFSPASVYDAGCAYGFTVDYFNLCGLESKGCDISEFAVSKSVTKNTYVHDIETSPIPEESNSYNVVLATELMEHIKDENVSFVFSELWRIVSEGGWLVLLIAFEGDEHAHDDITHCNLQRKRYWYPFIESLPKAMIDTLALEKLQRTQICKDMKWSNNLFILRKGLIPVFHAKH